LRLAFAASDGHSITAHCANGDDMGPQLGSRSLPEKRFQPRMAPLRSFR
jgi:hypothetical protein